MFKIGLYGVLIILGLELIVRVFHLHKDRPERYLDEYNVEKWVPNQSGVWVTGNRKQNVGHYRINNFGFNSVYDDFQTTSNEKEIALVGDSFIQGFHEDYQSSLGQNIEGLLNAKYKVLEFGYAGWDLADQLHMMQAYKHLFDNIEYIVTYMQFTTDLDRDKYTVSNRFSLDTPLSRFLKQIKTVVYLRDIGLLDPVTECLSGLKNRIQGKKIAEDSNRISENEINSLRLENFKRLIEKYNFDKEKNVLLIDFSLCSSQFITYLEQNNFKTINFNTAFKASKIPPTLIYDQHWSKHGRNLIANLIKEYLVSRGI